MGDEHVWADDTRDVDWDELSELYRLAPLGVKPPDALRTVFGNSMFTSFATADGALVAAGRAMADGLDCAYIADVAVHPDAQGTGLGQALIRRLLDAASGHRKVILYANPGTEGFYRRLGFLPMNTAMGVWADPESAVRGGILRAD
ncbi:MAG TPA: GNAT family N-acetyltransferase [Ilumatobacteraceae bacterium]|nr:GNAT family N-acetyltransferase [Ilumatobacteraceae bacterium]